MCEIQEKRREEKRRMLRYVFLQPNVIMRVVCVDVDVDVDIDAGVDVDVHGDASAPSGETLVEVPGDTDVRTIQCMSVLGRKINRTI